MEKTMSANFKRYLKNIESALKAGNATEHTHRPAFKALIESFDSHITATNEPKRIACGAPDYIITCRDVTVGYIEKLLSAGRRAALIFWVMP